MNITSGFKENNYSHIYITDTGNVYRHTHTKIDEDSKITKVNEWEYIEPRP